MGLGRERVGWDWGGRGWVGLDGTGKGEGGWDWGGGMDLSRGGM